MAIYQTCFKNKLVIFFLKSDLFFIVYAKQVTHFYRKVFENNCKTSTKI